MDKKDKLKTAWQIAQLAIIFSCCLVMFGDDSQCGFYLLENNLTS